jgi:hypothetical protein
MVINGHKSNDVKPIHDFYFSGWQSISDVAVCHGCHGFHVTFPLRDMEAGRGSEWGLSGVTLGSPGTTWYWGYYNIRLGTYLWLWEPNISYYNSCNREGVLYIGELYYILCCFQRFDYVWLCLTMFDYVWLVQVEFPLFLAIKFVDGDIRHKISSCFLLTIFTRWLYIHYIWWWCELNCPMILSHGPRIRIMIECWL